MIDTPKDLAELREKVEASKILDGARRR